MSPQDRQVVSLLSAAGNLHCDTVFYLSPVVSHQTPRTESLHNSGESRSVWRKGERCPEALPVLDGTPHARTRPGGAQCHPSRVAECARRAQCLSMHTIFSPQAPYFSLTSQPFSQTSVTSSLGAGAGNESSFPTGYC